MLPQMGKIGLPYLVGFIRTAMLVPPFWSLIHYSRRDEMVLVDNAIDTRWTQQSHILIGHPVGHLSMQQFRVGQGIIPDSPFLR